MADLITTINTAMHALIDSGHTLPGQTPRLTEYDLRDLPRLGWLVITDVGEENIYFTLSDGTTGFCKVLA